MIAGLLFVCTILSVHDGDGPIRCAEGPKVRLAAVAARELDGSCAPGHPCPDASGADARDRLRALAPAGTRLRCESAGMSYGRVVAWCRTAAGADLSCAMIRSGHASPWPRHDPAGRLRRCRI